MTLQIPTANPSVTDYKMSYFAIGTVCIRAEDKDCGTKEQYSTKINAVEFF